MTPSFGFRTEPDSWSSSTGCGQTTSFLWKHNEATCRTELTHSLQLVEWRSCFLQRLLKLVNQYCLLYIVYSNVYSIFKNGNGNSFVSIHGLPIEQVGVSIAMLLCQRLVIKRSMGVWTKRSPCLNNEAVEMIAPLSCRVLGGVKKYKLALNVSRLCKN